ncbi:hypothetical protein [Streptomyces sp. NPDC002553]|uniref:hypothetical protein n=1 Tax=Streptomyces sp. NPDC002553 TaxID=3154417 RepID=UPI00331A698E
MWLVDALASGFTHPTDPARIQRFWTIFGTVLTARFARAFGQGRSARLTTGSLSAYMAESPSATKWPGS